MTAKTMKRRKTKRFPKKGDVLWEIDLLGNFHALRVINPSHLDNREHHLCEFVSDRRKSRVIRQDLPGNMDRWGFSPEEALQRFKQSRYVEKENLRSRLRSVEDEIEKADLGAMAVFIERRDREKQPEPKKLTLSGFRKEMSHYGMARQATHGEEEDASEVWRGSSRSAEYTVTMKSKGLCDVERRPRYGYNNLSLYEDVTYGEASSKIDYHGIFFAD